MMKRFICIECPKGCDIAVTLENDTIIEITGNKCEKGEAYVHSEIENPMRILTSSVLAKGLALKMIPVRTSKPIPKSKLFDAMNEIKKIHVHDPVHCDEIIRRDFLDLGVNLVATRECKKNELNKGENQL